MEEERKKKEDAARAAAEEEAARRQVMKQMISSLCVSATGNVLHLTCTDAGFSLVVQ